MVADVVTELVGVVVWDDVAVEVGVVVTDVVTVVVGVVLSHDENVPSKNEPTASLSSAAVASQPTSTLSASPIVHPMFAGAVPPEYSVMMALSVALDALQSAVLVRADAEPTCAPQLTSAASLPRHFASIALSMLACGEQTAPSGNDKCATPAVLQSNCPTNAVVVGVVVGVVDVVGEVVAVVVAVVVCVEVGVVVVVVVGDVVAVVVAEVVAVVVAVVVADEVGLVVAVVVAVLVPVVVVVEVGVVVAVVVGVESLQVAKLPSPNEPIALLTVPATPLQPVSKIKYPPATQPMAGTVSSAYLLTISASSAGAVQLPRVSRTNELYPVRGTHSRLASTPEHSLITACNAATCASHRSGGAEKYVLPLKAWQLKKPSSGVVVGVVVPDVVGVVVADVVAVVVGVVVGEVVAVVVVVCDVVGVVVGVEVMVVVGVVVGVVVCVVVAVVVAEVVEVVLIVVVPDVVGDVVWLEVCVVVGVVVAVVVGVVVGEVVTVVV